MSRQALIFNRRHTQHKGSPGPPEVSAAQTEHFPGFFRRSVTIDSLACSRISGAITGSDLGGIFRFISVPPPEYNYSAPFTARHKLKSTGKLRLLRVAGPQRPRPRTKHSADIFARAIPSPLSR